MLNDKSTHKIIVGGLLIIMGILFFSGNVNAAISNSTLDRVWQFSNTMSDNITGATWSNSFSYITAGGGLNGLAGNTTTHTSVSIPLSIKTNSWTLVWWMMDTTGTGGGNGIFRTHDGTNGMAVRNYPTKFDYYDGSSYRDVAVSKTNGRWHMYSMVVGGGNINFYQNTTLLATNAHGNLNTGYSTIDLSGSGGWNYVFDAIDEIMLFNNTLDSSNITELYNSGAGKFYPFEGSDTTTPTITNIGSNYPNGTYGVGTKIPINITFSEVVYVNNTNGNATLDLNSSGIANYNSGNVTNTLTFIYTISAGQNSPHLDYNATNSLSLPSGSTIKDLAGNNANLTLFSPNTAGSLGANTNFVIDTLPSSPQWSTINVSPVSGSGYISGRAFQFNVTWTNYTTLSFVKFEHNFNGSLVNYTPNGNLSSIFYYNYNDIQTGTYQWKSYAQDVNGKSNFTDSQIYVVSQSAQGNSLGTATLSLATCGLSFNNTFNFSTTIIGQNSTETYLPITNTGTYTSEVRLKGVNWTSSNISQYLPVTRTYFKNETGTIYTKNQLQLTDSTLFGTIFGLSSKYAYFQVNSELGDSNNMYSQNMTVSIIC